MVLGVACIAGANLVARWFGCGAVATPWSVVDDAATILLVSLPALIVRRAMFPASAPPAGLSAAAIHFAACMCGAVSFVVGWWLVAALCGLWTIGVGWPLVLCLLDFDALGLLGAVPVAMAVVLIGVLAVGSRRAWARAVRGLAWGLAWPTALLTTAMVGLGAWWRHVEGDPATASLEIGRHSSGCSEFVALRRDADYPDRASWVRVEQRVPIVPNLLEWRRTCLRPRAGREVVFAVADGFVRVTVDPGTSHAEVVVIGGS